MTEQPREGEQDEQVPGGGLSGNEDGASSDGDSGPQGAGGAVETGEARDDEAQES
ncbi:MAG TPA: hypothetical protein VFH94_08230 [Streptomyces sp.]|nr:hypothetical protein [Pedococcus sp.]HET6857067.1 hypothetical protein [Streptomyces sp.]